MDPSAPLRFRPILKERVWGGRRLETLLQKPLPGPGPYGESWEISDCGADRSLVAEGPFAGRDLADLLARYPEAILGRGGQGRAGPGRGEGFPLLFKAIDAADRLSVQLHPSDAEAALLGPGLLGKSEAWAILDALPGAGVIHGPHEPAAREALLRACASGDRAEIESRLVWTPVRAGDLVYLPAGTIHAIGGGILLLEVQESSDLTYRVYDWGRAGLDGKPRELHLAEARRVAPPAQPPRPPWPNLLDPPPAGPAAGKIRRMIECPHFTIDALRLDASSPIWAGSTSHHGKASFIVLGGVAGKGWLKTAREKSGMEIGRGEFLLIPAAAGEFGIETDAHFTGILARE